MHPAALDQMALSIKTYLRTDRPYRVMDLGSRVSERQELSHRALLSGYDVDYVGVDVKPGRNVDIVLAKPYRIDLKSRSVDVVLSGQVFEHIAFPWVTMLEIARVLRPRGWAFITAPSRGHVHDTYDAWRYYPDSWRALAAFSRLTLKEAHADFPPVRRGTDRHHYRAIDQDGHYWGDSVAVFRKSTRYPERKIALPREVLVRWANRVGDLDQVPLPAARPARLALDGKRLRRKVTADGAPDALGSGGADGAPVVG